MASNHFSFSIGEKSIPEIESSLELSDEHGADFRFLGVVRKTEGDRPIDGILYTAYQSMALLEMEKIGSSLQARFPDHLALVYHRVGFVSIGEASILIRVQSRHSAEGLVLIQEYLRRIKTSVPIWKKILFSDAEQPEGL